jgi:hypothetical protein
MSQRHDSRLFTWLTQHWIATFVLMGFAFVIFGLASYNLVQYVAANVRFLSMHGTDAVREGGLWQLVELCVTAYVSVAFYVLFKACEHALVERLAHYKHHKST